VHRRLQLRERVLPGAVQPERFPDEDGPLGVEHDLGDVLAGLLLPDVLVADRRLRGPAAHLGLLGHALSDLTGKVRRVELGHERVDALHEASGGRLLDVFGHRHKLDPGTPQCRPYRHVVLHGAGQTIDLVHDDGTDPAVGHAAKQRLEHRTVRRPRRLAGVDELACEVPPSFGDVAMARLALRRDRVALR
jgi:hypothetical protein